MSIASSSYKPKSFQESSDLQDLRQQIKVLAQQNQILTAQLQELIEVNNQLTSSIQQYSKLHEQKFGPIDQSQLEELVHQVNLLQQELIEEKERNYNFMIKNTQKEQNKNKTHSRHSSRQMPEQKDFNTEQIFGVIKQLTNSIHYLQEQFQQNIENLQTEFNKQKFESQQMLKQLENKFMSFQQITSQLIAQMQNKDQTIFSLNRQLDMQRTKKSQIHKQMKISLTIQDLKNTLQKRIQQKEQVIKFYETLISNLKTKFQDFPF